MRVNVVIHFMSAQLGHWRIFDDFQLALTLIAYQGRRCSLSSHVGVCPGRRRTRPSVKITNRKDFSIIYFTIWWPFLWSDFALLFRHLFRPLFFFLIPATVAYVFSHFLAYIFLPPLGSLFIFAKAIGVGLWPQHRIPQFWSNSVYHYLATYWFFNFHLLIFSLDFFPVASLPLFVFLCVFFFYLCFCAAVSLCFVCCVRGRI